MKNAATEKAPMWAVMKAHSFSTLEVNGKPLGPPRNGPQRFIPVFDTRKQADAYANGKAEVLMCIPVDMADVPPPQPDPIKRR